MAAKEIIYTDNARNLILAGVNTLVHRRLGGINCKCEWLREDDGGACSSSSPKTSKR
jgi:hypothetical protein